MGILSGLFGNLDPFAQQGLIAQLFGPSANLNTPTSQPAPPVGQGTSSTNPPPQPGSSGLPAAFRPLPSLFGNSMLGNGLRGGLAGLGSSTGYTGLAALGAGAAGGSQATQERQRFNANNMMAGQQYQQGQQGILQGNLQMAQALSQYNIWNKQFNPNARDLTFQDLQDPQTLAQVMSTVGQIGQGQPPTSAPPQPQAASASSGQPQQNIPLEAYYKAFQANEGSGPDATSPKGAKGVYQIMPDTFKQYAQPGESFDNERDRETVAQRYIGDLYSKYGQNPDQMAAAYFAGSPNANPNASDGNMTVAQYQGNLRQNLGLGGSQGAAGDVGPQGQPGVGGGPDPVTAEFMQIHGGMTPAQWGQLGMRLRRPDMVAEAMKYDPAMIYGQKALETQAVQDNTPHELRAGAQLQNSQGQGIGKGVPTPIKIYDPKSGNYVAGQRYPDGSLVIGNEAGGQPATEELGPGNEDLQKGYAARRTEMGNAINGGIVASQRLDAMADAFKTITSGALAPEKAHAAAILKGMGIDVGNMLGDPAAANQVLHDNVLATFAMIKPFVGGRVAAAEVQRLADALPNLGLQPEANLKILAQLQGVMKYDRDLYEQLSSQPGNVDPNNFEIQFNKQHPLTKYVSDAEASIGPLQGMQGAQTGGGTPGVNGVPWPKEKPATLAAGADDQATLTWFDRLPKGSWFINPGGKHELIQKTKERFKGAGQ